MLEAFPNRQSVTALGCFAALALAVLVVMFGRELSWLGQVPASFSLPVSNWTNAAITGFSTEFRSVFRFVGDALNWQLKTLQSVLLDIPWSVMVVVLTLGALRIAGPGLAALTAATCLYIVFAGYWKESIATLTLVSLGLPLACIFGAALGILAHSNRYVAAAVDAVLDVMQTVPAFAYLTPLIVLFGFGPVAGLVASVLFALPPMTRNVKVGLDQTPREAIEAAEIAGCSRLQMFALVRLGAATRQILMGLNQTIMATLSMVIFAAVIGGFEDIGWEVLRAARRAEFGNGIIAGLVVTLLAILLDRVSEAAFVRERQPQSKLSAKSFWGLTFLAGAVVWVVIAPLLPSPAQLSMRAYLAPVLNDTLMSVSVYLSTVTATLKSVITTYFLLPLRIGLMRTLTPAIWGFEMSPALMAIYVAVFCGSALVLAFRQQVGVALGVLFTGLLLYTGFSGMPWLPLIAGLTLVGWWLGGIRLAAITAGGLMAIAVSGFWPSTMFSAYLMAASIITAIVLGGLLGVLAAEYEPVSRTMRPVNDFLQTIPPFVILIPLIMFFQVGDFSSYLAIVAYAIVPMARYTEQGLRHVPATQIDAGHLAGCTPLQLLFLVKFPAARGDIILGLNQTIMAALAMLAVAALVGSRGLGQDVYIALSKADSGMGLLAGLSIATLAMISDRFMRRMAVQ